MQRVAYSPKEFAALFGKSQAWGYRKIYQGAVVTVTEFGRTMIPASEVEKILGTAHAYQPSEPAEPQSTGKKSGSSISRIFLRGFKSSAAGRAKRVHVPRGFPTERKAVGVSRMLHQSDPGKEPDLE